MERTDSPEKDPCIYAYLNFNRRTIPKDVNFTQAEIVKYSFWKIWMYAPNSLHTQIWIQLSYRPECQRQNYKAFKRKWKLIYSWPLGSFLNKT